LRGAVVAMALCCPPVRRPWGAVGNLSCMFICFPFPHLCNSFQKNTHLHFSFLAEMDSGVFFPSRFRWSLNSKKLELFASYTHGGYVFLDVKREFAHISYSQFLPPPSPACKDASMTISPPRFNKTHHCQVCNYLSAYPMVCSYVLNMDFKLFEIVHCKRKDPHKIETHVSQNLWQ